MQTTRMTNPWKDMSDSILDVAIDNIEPKPKEDDLYDQDYPYIYASILSSAASGNLIYLEREKCFKVFSSETGNWTPVSERKMVILMRDAISQINKYLEGHDTDIRPVIRHTDRRRIKAILEELKTKIYEDAEQSRPKGVIHVRNGFLEPDNSDGSWTVKFVKNEDGKDYHFCTAFGVEYDNEAQCPQFLAYLSKSGLNANDQNLLQEYCGQIILGLGNRSQRLLFIDGPWETGISTIGELLVIILGEENVVVLHSDSFGGRFDLARYSNKLCILGMDIPRDVLFKRWWALKALTGGGFLQGSLHDSDKEVGFYGNLSVILTSNDRLQLNLGGENDISAFKHRLASITFSRAGNTQMSPSLRDELMTEANGIFNWMLQGALRVCEHDGIITLTSEQEQHVNAILNETRTAETFVNDCVDEDKNRSVTTQELKEEYFKYCDKKQLQPLSERTAEQQILRAILKRYPQQHQRHDIKPNYDETGIKSVHRGFNGLTITKNY